VDFGYRNKDLRKKPFFVILAVLGTKKRTLFKIAKIIAWLILGLVVWRELKYAVYFPGTQVL
jgi:hypothetical protein